MKYDGLIEELQQMKIDTDEMILQLYGLFPDEEKINECHSKLKIRMQRISHEKSILLGKPIVKRQAKHKRESPSYEAT